MINLDQRIICFACERKAGERDPMAQIVQSQVVTDITIVKPM